MSVTGLSTRGIPNSLTGLETINASYNAKFVPYVGAATTVNLGAQNITTTHQATNSFDLVNLQVLTNAIDFVNTANALTYLNKVTSDAQTVNSNQVSFQGAISASSVGVNGSYLFNKTGPFSHGWVIDRMIGTGSILKDLVFRDAETSVDCLKLSEDGQIIYVGLTCDYATANKVPIFNADKKLVSSGVDAIKITYLDNVSSDIQTQLNGKVPLVGPAQLSNTFEFTSPVPINLSGLTASRVLQLDASKNVQVSSVTTTELGYVSGVTSAIQTQLNGKVPLVGPAQLSNTFEFTSPVPMTLSGLTASRVLQLGASNNVQVSAVTTTELGYVSGVTSAIQTQLNTLSGTFANYLPLTGGTLSGSLTANGSITTKGSFYMWDTTTNARLQVDTGAGAYVIFEGYKNADYATKYPLLLQPNGGSVGIGTTVVLALFNINYDGGQDFLTLQNAKYLDGQYINIRFMFGKNNTTQASAYIQAYLNSSLATALRFFTDDGSGSGVAERARLTGDGYFGIGTVAPDVELNVVGKAKIHNGTVGAPANGTNGGNGTRLVLWPGNAGSCPYALGIDGGTLWYGTPTSATHKWYNGTTNVMGLDGNGNMYRSNYVPYLFTNMFVSTSGSNGSLAVCAGNENDNAILYLGTPYSPTVSSGSAYKVAIIADGNGSGTGWSTADLHFCLNGTTGSNDWTQSAGLSHSRMVIKSSNYYVGIGTASPVGQLDIYNTGADYTNSLVVRTPWAGITMDNTQVGGGRKWHIFSGGPSAGIGVGNFGIYDGTANAYRFDINSGGEVKVHLRLTVGGNHDSNCVFNVRNQNGNYTHFGYSNNVNYIRNNTIFDTGYVSIGTQYAWPMPLWVTASQLQSWYLAWYAGNGGAFFHNSSGTWPVSIWASGAIVTEYWFGTVSDRRIKTNIKPVGDMLDIINKIEVVSFDFIDPITHKRDECGVIAQQVEEVFPNLVDKSIGVIPNILKCVSAFEKIGETLKLYYKRQDSDELSPTSKVKLLLGVLGQTVEESSSKGEYLVHVIDVGSDFIVVEWEHNVVLDGLSVFVYGKEVDDFRNVDKEQLGVMAIKGIQELHSIATSHAKQIDVLTQKLEMLQQQVAALSGSIRNY